MAKNNNRQRRAKLAAQQKQQSKGIAAPGGGKTAGTSSTAAADADTNGTSTANTPPPRRTMSPLRWLLMFGATCYFFVTAFQKQLLPYGMPIKMDASRKEFQSDIDFSNDSLQIKHGRTKRIYERLLEKGHQKQQQPLMVGPETIVFGKDGTLYVLSEHGNLVSMTDFHEEQQDDDGSSSSSSMMITAKSKIVKDLGVGRPLAGKFTADGKTLYIADAVLGLTRVRNVHDPKSKVELVASSFVVDDQQDNSSNVVVQQLLLVDDVCIGPKSGKVYFTDASSVAPERTRSSGGMSPSLLWDCLYPSKVDFLRGKKTGRILEYDPKTDKVTLLAKDIHFANGISVDKDESFLFFAETFAPRLWKYHLKGNQKGTMEVAVPGEKLAGYPDGVDCSWSATSKKGKDAAKCYTVLVSSIIPTHKFLAKMPDIVDVVLRTLLLLLPRNLAPEPIPYAGILEVDPVTLQQRYIQDPTGADISMLTGVTVHKNKLYLGSIRNNYIGVYDLSNSKPATK